MEEIRSTVLFPLSLSLLVFLPFLGLGDDSRSQTGFPQAILITKKYTPLLLVSKTVIEQAILITGNYTPPSLLSKTVIKQAILITGNYTPPLLVSETVIEQAILITGNYTPLSLLSKTVIKQAILITGNYTPPSLVSKIVTFIALQLRNVNSEQFSTLKFWSWTHSKSFSKSHIVLNLSFAFVSLVMVIHSTKFCHCSPTKSSWYS